MPSSPNSPRSGDTLAAALAVPVLSAVTPAWRIEAPAALLDSYDRERRPVARASADTLRYEKAMLDDWFRGHFDPQSKQAVAAHKP